MAERTLADAIVGEVLIEEWPRWERNRRVVTVTALGPGVVFTSDNMMYHRKTGLGLPGLALLYGSTLRFPRDGELEELRENEGAGE